MQSISVFLNIAKFADFRWKNADVSRTQGVWHDSYMFWIFFWQGITVPSFIIVGCVTDFRDGGPFCPPPIREQPQKSPSWIGLTTSSNIVSTTTDITFWEFRFLCQILFSPQVKRNILAKNCWKIEIRIFCTGVFHILGYFTWKLELSQIFCPWLLLQTIFWS